MKRWSEGKAACVAVAVSVATLLGTFGLAFVMRNVRSSVGLPDVPATAQAKMLPADLTGDAAQGRHLFLMNCAHCHGDDARGDEGPDLHDLRKNDERIHQIITAGIKGEMPSFGKKLKDSDVRELTAYLRTLRS
jgi:mono/diheme cytochrome c family protein